ncbi:hypothetical protein ONZ43_g4935 [Nemania bipapillata]|uniref:Uncharacterized protein n=1 Tax=Nemania bipapillata TaxID=110536 RepID=A0ACC2IGS3_9PEZI|nr:hypothetical protein ONZ43_g4935 [Nemania bipapillata]
MAQEKKFVLITGCGRGGIGEALALEYTLRGLRVIATVLPQESSDHFSNTGITHFPLDVTDEQSIRNLKSEVQALTGGRLDVLVNCAGIAYTMTAIDTDVTAVQRMFDINVFGPMRMVRSFHDLLIAAKGVVVNIGSIGASYNASKAALAHWGNTLRVEMKPLGVKVITVCLGQFSRRGHALTFLLQIISGEVSTNILKSDAHRSLPEGSFYSPLAEEFKLHVNRTPAGATDRFKYAKNVVATSLQTAPPAWYWYGSHTSLTRFFDTFGWRTVWDSMMWNMFGLQKLEDAHKGSANKDI